MLRLLTKVSLECAVARSDPRPPGMRTVVEGSILTSFVEFCHETIPMATLFIPLIQEGQLSVTGKIICTSTGKLCPK